MKNHDFQIGDIWWLESNQLPYGNNYYHVYRACKRETPNMERIEHFSLQLCRKNQSTFSVITKLCTIDPTNIAKAVLISRSEVAYSDHDLKLGDEVRLLQMHTRPGTGAIAVTLAAGTIGRVYEIVKTSFGGTAWVYFSGKNCSRLLSFGEFEVTTASRLVSTLKGDEDDL